MQERIFGGYSSLNFVATRELKERLSFSVIYWLAFGRFSGELDTAAHMS